VLGLFVVGVTNWSGEGVEPKSLSMSIRFVSPCDGFPPLPFIDAREKGRKGNKRKVIVFDRWDVPLCVPVCLGALKRSRAMQWRSWRVSMPRANIEVPKLHGTPDQST
jgi:hypothetical protein